jgi:hypothetical protein
VGLRKVSIVIVSIFVGTLCGLFRLRVLVVVPLSALFASWSAVSGLVTHAYSWSIVVYVIGSLAGLQLAYVCWSVFAFLVFRSDHCKDSAAIDQRLNLRSRKICRPNYPR